MQTRGLPTCSGAIFIYKKDDSVQDALDAAQQVAKEHYSRAEYTPEQKARIIKLFGYDPTARDGDFVYVVHADLKSELLAELTRWSRSVDPSNSALMIYTHSGPLGINRIGGDNDHRVLWSELSAALSCGVSSLWLVGCKSKACLDAWASDGGPARNWMACTATKEYWKKLIPYFLDEISLEVRMPEDVAARLQKEFNDTVEYFERNATWKRLGTAVAADDSDEAASDEEV